MGEKTLCDSNGLMFQSEEISRRSHAVGWAIVRGTGFLNIVVLMFLGLFILQESGSNCNHCDSDSTEVLPQGASASGDSEKLLFLPSSWEHQD